MKTKLKKLSALLLALGTLFILSFPNIAHAEDTGDSEHFQLTVIENKDSKSGAEVADLTVKNISGKTGENVTFEADLPTIFHDKDMKKATFNVGTLMAGESKTYQVSRKSDGTVTTNPLPITGNNSTTSALPKTGDVAPPLFITVGLFLVAGIVIIGFKRFRGAKSLFAIMLLLAGVCGTVTVNASEKSYHHRDEVRNHAVALSGTTYVFHLAANGDFEDDDTDTGDNSGNTGGDNGGSEVMKNFTITYYIKGAKVTGLAPDGYTTGDKTIALPKPKLVGDEFLGWYDNENCDGNVITSIAKDATGDKLFYGKTTPRMYQVAFDSTGGESVPPVIVTHGEKVSEPVAPTKDDAIPNDALAPHDFEFKGWYTDADLTTPFDFDTPITEPITLYAKWGLPITEAGLVNPSVASYADGKLGTQGDEVWFANSWFQILDEDMDDDASNGLQALVIKIEDIGDSKFNGIGPTYFDASGTNGYDRSRSDGGVGQVIDTWYNTTIASNPTLEALVQKVELNNPDFTIFSAIGLDKNLGPQAWSWSAYSHDTRFATTLTASGSQQAFALSFGDIHGHMGVPEAEDTVPLLDFPNRVGVFWLRSPGFNSQFVGVVGNGLIFYCSGVDYIMPVLPALSLRID